MTSLGLREGTGRPAVNVVNHEELQVVQRINKIKILESPTQRDSLVTEHQGPSKFNKPEFRFIQEEILNRVKTLSLSSKKHQRQTTILRSPNSSVHKLREKPHLRSETQFNIKASSQVKILRKTLEELPAGKLHPLQLILNHQFEESPRFLRQQRTTSRRRESQVTSLHFQMQTRDSISF